MKLLAALGLACAAASAQTTAFTYQGRLTNGQQPAAGLHDFQFRLFDAAAGGAQVGSTQCADNMLVVAGLFTATIDFGQQFATTAPRYLEIQVRADTGLDCSSATGFVPLTPRQPLTAAPIASHAKSAFALDAPDGSPANALVVGNDGQIGIGTTTPTVPLHLTHGDPVMVLQDSGSALTQSGYLGFWNASGAETAWVGFGTPGSPHLGIVNARSTGNIMLLPGPNGRVTIGTASGQLFATAADENLRIVRGWVEASGAIFTGSGYSVALTGAGRFRVTFSTPFAGRPSVTVTPSSHTVPAGSWTAAVGETTNNYADIFTYVSGASDEVPFRFIAVGPR